MVLNQLVDQQHLLLDLPHQPLELDLNMDLDPVYGTEMEGLSGDFIYTDATGIGYAAGTGSTYANGPPGAVYGYGSATGFAPTYYRYQSRSGGLG